MLQFLRIENLVLIERQILEFGPGFIALTGETGAGKSILLGALNLLSGSRAEKSLIREGSDTLKLEASFYVDEQSPMTKALEELNLPPCEENTLLISRQISHTRSPRILINGQLSPLSTLRKLGRFWIDFHGPGDAQQLFNPEHQLNLLDAYARNESLLENYRQHYKEWLDAKAALHELENKQALSPDEIVFLESQIQRINDIVKSPEQIEELENAYQRLEHQEDVLDDLNRIIDAHYGKTGILNQLNQSLQCARNLAERDSSCTDVSDRLESCLLELEDLVDTFEHMRQNLNLSPEAIHKIRQNMDGWLSLKRQYGNSVETVLLKKESLQSRLALQGDLSGELKRLESQIQAHETHLHDWAERIRQKRVKAAKSFAQKVQPILAKLGFQKSGFSVVVRREKTFKSHGASTCEFLFAPNVGQSPKPLNKIASSGELARVLLALKSVLAHVDAIPVLVFDEVDANVGGEIAGHVAEELKRLSASHQVFCITHLPQVAAKAKQHFLVQKGQTETTTSILIHELTENSEKRLNELARMLGNRHSLTAKTHAQTLLEDENDPTK